MYGIRWAAHWHNLANTIEPSMCGGDAACCQITLTTCYQLVPGITTDFDTDVHKGIQDLLVGLTHESDLKTCDCPSGST